VKLLRRFLLLAVAAIAIGAFAAATDPSPSGPAELDGLRSIAQQQSVQGACDVDGVDVAYRTSYRGDSPLGYDAVEVVVRNIAWPSCKDATLDVVLGDGTQTDRALGQLVLSTANVTAAGGNAHADVTAALKSSPSQRADARWIASVGVAIAGGYTPTPPECAGMQFATIRVATTEDDTIEGSNPAGDLIYSLTGLDRITSLQGDDCLVTGADTEGDTVVAGNGNNVVKTGTDQVGGNDSITVGNGANRIFAGAGDDTIRIGSGNAKATSIESGPGTDTCFIPKSAKKFTHDCDVVVRT
jgi:hypothetical protein